jgi:hypothetical protein
MPDLPLSACDRRPTGGVVLTDATGGRKSADLTPRHGRLAPDFRQVRGEFAGGTRKWCGTR